MKRLESSDRRNLCLLKEDILLVLLVEVLQVLVLVLVLEVLLVRRWEEEVGLVVVVHAAVAASSGVGEEAGGLEKGGRCEWSGRCGCRVMAATLRLDGHRGTERCAAGGHRTSTTNTHHHHRRWWRTTTTSSATSGGHLENGALLRTVHFVAVQKISPSWWGGGVVVVVLVRGRVGYGSRSGRKTGGRSVGESGDWKLGAIK